MNLSRSQFQRSLPPKFQNCDSLNPIQHNCGPYHFGSSPILSFPLIST